MARSNRSARRWKVTLIWVALLSLLSQASAHAQDDDCERLTDGGATRDCTYLEEMRDCVDDANHSFDDCYDDALSKDGFIETSLNLIGCEAAFLVNLTACATGVTTDWHFGDLL